MNYSNFLNSKIVFAHIPKTAGTSFRKAVEQKYPSSFVRKDYGEKSPETSIEIRRSYSSDFFDLFDEYNAKKGFILSGHFHDTKIGLNGYLNCLNNVSAVVFFRDPISRVISEYNHFKERLDHNGDFSNFIRNENFINRQTMSISDMPLNSFDFVGLTESYADCIETFNQIYGASLAVNKVNESTSAMAFTDVSKKDMDFFCHANAKDIALYNKAVEHSYRLQRKSLPGVYDRRYQWNVSIDKGRYLKGWCFDSHSSHPVNVCLSSGSFSIEKLAINYIHELKDKQVHLSGYAGFEFDLHDFQGLVGGGDVKLKIKNGPIVYVV